ncbi:hypothetical protein ACIGBL_34510 [Streptomyces sp. NPDC085614]|uniref:hypothetical protein n=1 Tax=Streptomyces sp. NPDC085614 TaxID=3365733 RepID=UPI0037D13234
MTISNCDKEQALLGVVQLRVLRSHTTEQTLRQWVVPILTALSIVRYKPRNSDSVVRNFYGDLHRVIHRHLRAVAGDVPVTIWFLRILRCIDEESLRQDDYAKVLMAACRALSCTLHTLDMAALLPPGGVPRAAEQIRIRMLAALSPIASTIESAPPATAE